MFSALPGYDGGSSVILNPLWSNVVLALHGDGTNGSTTITDSKNGYTPSATYLGSVTISTTQSKFGGASIKLPNAGGLVYASASADTNFTFGTGDFCIRMWVYWDGTTANAHVLVDTRASGGSVSGFVWYIDTDGKLYLYSGTSLYYTGAAAFPSNQWVHVALARSSTVAKVFQNGTVMSSFSFASNYIDGRFAVGDVTHAYTNSTAVFAGYFDDVEVIKGEALYTAAYTPPSAAFPNS